MNHEYYRILEEIQDTDFFREIVKFLKKYDSYVNNTSKEIVVIAYKEKDKPSGEFFEMFYKISSLQQDPDTALRIYKEKEKKKESMMVVEE